MYKKYILYMIYSFQNKTVYLKIKQTKKTLFLFQNTLIPSSD